MLSCDKDSIIRPDSLTSGYGSADSVAFSSDSQILNDSNSKLNFSVALAETEDSNVSKKTKKEPVKTSSKQRSSPSEKKKEKSVNPKQQSFPTKKKKEDVNVPVDEPLKQVSSSAPVSGSSSDMFSLWVEKYKPQSSKKIIGQQGEKSNVNKLIYWLNNWYKNNTGSKKASFVPGN